MLALQDKFLREVLDTIVAMEESDIFREPVDLEAYPVSRGGGAAAPIPPVFTVLSV